MVVIFNDALPWEKIGKITLPHPRLDVFKQSEILCHIQTISCQTKVYSTWSNLSDITVMSFEPRKKPSYFPWNPGREIGILVMVSFNPHKTGQ